MPLPTLNTNFVNSKSMDMTNTLMNIQKMKETKTKNSLIDLQMKNEKAKKRNSDIDFQLKMFNFIDEGTVATSASVAVKDYDAIDRNRAFMIKRGVPEEVLPPSSFFYDTKPDISPGSTGGMTKVFNKERYDTYTTNSLKTGADIIKDGENAKKNYEKIEVYGPDGQTGTVWTKKGEDYFAEKELGKGWTSNKPEKQEKPDKTLVKVVGEDGKAKWIKRSEADGKPAPNPSSAVKELTKQQLINNKRNVKKDLVDLEDKINKVSSKGRPSAHLINKEPTTAILQFNELSPTYEYVYTDDVYDSTKNPEDYNKWEKFKGFFDIESNEKIGGWVKQKKKGKSRSLAPKVGTDNTETEIKAMKTGDTFTVNGKTYTKR